ncbi:MAG TPA: beta-galactosidase [Planctomycetota bacterium]|nr:beta-galactosidase [Planctomycetota bacterium]
MKWSAGRRTAKLAAIMIAACVCSQHLRAGEPPPPDKPPRPAFIDPGAGPDALPRLDPNDDIAGETVALPTFKLASESALRLHALNTLPSLLPKSLDPRIFNASNTQPPPDPPRLLYALNELPNPRPKSLDPRLLSAPPREVVKSESPIWYALNQLPNPCPKSLDPSIFNPAQAARAQDAVNWYALLANIRAQLSYALSAAPKPHPAPPEREPLFHALNELPNPKPKSLDSRIFIAPPEKPAKAESLWYAINDLPNPRPKSVDPRFLKAGAVAPVKMESPLWYALNALPNPRPRSLDPRILRAAVVNPVPHEEPLWLALNELPNPRPKSLDRRLVANVSAEPPPETELKPPELTLTLETPAIKSGEAASFSIGGPDNFLRAAIADFSLSDELGRMLAHGRIPVGAMPFVDGLRRFKLSPPIDLALPPEKYKGSGALLRLHADLAFSVGSAQPVKLGADLVVERAIEPRMKEWNRWIALTTLPPADGSWEKLNALGISGGMQIRTNSARRESLKKGNAPFYVENVTRQLLSRYQTEKGLWQKTVGAMAQNRNSTEPLARDPSLNAPAFADAFAGEIARIGEAYSGESPLFFSLASEPSMTRLNASADFDFSAPALDEFRRWLEREAYGTLPALNESWGTQFTSWQAIVPMTTDDARLRLRDGIGNFAPWADFREFQDYTFSKVLREGGDLLRAKIPNARCGITGAMGPFAFGGWDWSRLASDLDVVEAYDIGGARALWRDLAPGKPALAAIMLSSDGRATAAPEIVQTVWNVALDGGPRGALFWDLAPASGGDSVLINANGSATELARAISPALNELNDEAGRVLAQARRAHDGVAVLYSPASIRMYWLLEADRLHGAEWLNAWGLDSSAERRESLQLRLRESWGKLLDDIGIGWRFVSSREIEHGALGRAENGIKTLILPRAIALSDREVEMIKQFAANGGRVVADAVCARFDEHGRLRPHPALDELFGVSTSTEPFFAQTTNALDRVAALPGMDGAWANWNAEFFVNLPPVFSDEPKWIEPERSGKRKGGEYRLSPVMASRGNAYFLNLDLADYLRWRLHPELPRARAAQEVLSGLVLKKNLDSSPVNWRATHLPHGTQVIRLRLGNSGGYLLALRRNPQARLHELGVEGDGNWAFEKAEPFELQFNDDIWLGAVYPAVANVADAGKRKHVRTIAGVLDPVVPTILAIQPGEPGVLKLSAPPDVLKLQRMEIAIQPPESPRLPDADQPREDAASALYCVSVLGPDRAERAHYGGIFSAKNGKLSHIFAFALNDPAGEWTIDVRDALSGASAETKVQLKESE